MHYRNFDHHMAALTFTYDMNVVDEWVESFDGLMCEDEGISPTKEVILFCAVNLWRKGRQDYANAIPAHKRQLFRCWARWTDHFLKEAVSLYPDGAGVTKADVEREAER